MVEPPLLYHNHDWLRQVKAEQDAANMEWKRTWLLRRTSAEVKLKLPQKHVMTHDLVLAPLELGMNLTLVCAVGLEPKPNLQLAVNYSRTEPRMHSTRAANANPGMTLEHSTVDRSSALLPSTTVCLCSSSWRRAPPMV